MKKGKTLTELANEIERRQDLKHDLIAPMPKLSVFVTDTGEPRMLARLPKGDEHFGIQQLAHNQIAEQLKIPAAYYNRMLAEQPSLLADNINTWLQNPPTNNTGTTRGSMVETKRRMVRTMDGKVRAFLSDKYRSLENEDLAEAVLPVLLQRKLIILSCDITETRLYIKAVDPALEQDVPSGHKRGDGSHVIYDTCSPAITISNSEVGFGALSIETGTYTKACTNLAMFGASMRKYHTGSRAELSDEVFALLSDRTKRITDAAVWSQVRDLVGAAFDKEKFEATCQKLTTASEQKIEDDVVQVVERVAKRFTFSEGERAGVLKRLIEGADLTRYGLHAAITRHSADVDDYDRASVLERLGGEIIELPKSDWQAIAEAA
jgi:hypothetical protein